MIQVKQIITGQIEENCYLIYNDTSLLIVDPGNDAEKIISLVKETGTTPEAILITHAHYDHIDALEQVRNEFNLPVYISPIEKE